VSYSAEISRNNPTQFVFLLDQSGSMADTFGEARIRKADVLADVANRTLHDLVIRCTKSEEIRNYYEIVVLGYGASSDTPVISSFGGALGPASVVKISEVAEHPVRLEDRTKKIPDGAGGIVEQSVRFPIWVEPQAGNGTPMCTALAQAKTIVEDWLSKHPNCFPPAVLHITDGESGDGDPTSFGLAISALKSSDGNVLMFNCHLSSQRTSTVEYPSSPDALPNDFAKTLYGMSSEIPEPFRRSAAQAGINLAEAARGFVFNADPAALVQFFDIGTRPANLR
jgi:hypothetical protein